MAQNKKKTKSPAKKNSKSPVKKKSRIIAKKAVKSTAKKKVASVKKMKPISRLRKKVVRAAKAKTKSPVIKKVATSNKKIKSAPQQAPVPEVTKQEVEVQPIPVDKEMLPTMEEEHKISEHQFENREDVIMNQENQRVKSAMANRQGTKRVFRTQRHS